MTAVFARETMGAMRTVFGADCPPLTYDQGFDDGRNGRKMQPCSSTPDYNRGYADGEADAGLGASRIMGLSPGELTWPKILLAGVVGWIGYRVFFKPRSRWF